MHTWTPSAPYRTTTESITVAIREAAQGTGAVPLTVRRYLKLREQHPAWPHPKTILQRYGNWTAALVDAHLEQSRA